MLYYRIVPWPPGVRWQLIILIILMRTITNDNDSIVIMTGDFVYTSRSVRVIRAQGPC